MRPSHLTPLALLASLLSSLACASPGSEAPVEEKQEKQAKREGARVAQPDAATVQRARAAGLPAVDPAGKVAGPFAGPQRPSRPC